MFEIGTVIRADSGREKGRIFVIIGFVSDKNIDYALIADGKERKIEKPKKKNVKHISKINLKIEIKSLTNRKLRSIIRNVL